MSFDLKIKADRDKYLALRKQQIEADTKISKDQFGKEYTRKGHLKTCEILACGCIIQRWTNAEGTHIVERDWVDAGPHTDGASLD
jgi:hypothetical protein